MDSQQVPTIIYEHLASNTIAQLEPAWIELAPNSEVIQGVGGAWQNYFSSKPELGSKITETCEILMGMLPITENFELPQIQLIDDQYTDISALHGEDCDWILFCDATQNTKQLQHYQQTSNDLVLLKGQLNRTLNRYVGQEISARASKGDLQFNSEGERKEISTLFVDIRGFTPFNETHDAQEVMQTLNQYMDCMLKPIMSEAGLVDKIIGDGVMAVFGVLPSTQHSARDAFNAAQQMLQKALLLNQQRQAQGLEQLGIGIGIATGCAVLGILGSHERRAFTAIGKHVNLAARLESNARVGEILIDTESLQALDQPALFTPTSLNLKGIGTTEVHSYLMKCIESPA